MPVIGFVVVLSAVLGAVAGGQGFLFDRGGAENPAVLHAPEFVADVLAAPSTDAPVIDASEPAHEQQAGPAAHGLCLCFMDLDSLLVMSEAVVLARVTAVEHYDETTVDGGDGGLRRRGIGDGISLDIIEVLKHTSGELEAGPLTVRHGASLEVEDPMGLDFMHERGHLAVSEGATVVVFLNQKTSSDGTRYWGLAGTPGIGEVREDGIAFLADQAYRDIIAATRATNSTDEYFEPRGGDAPFTTTLDELRVLAAASQDPSEIDPRRDTVPPLPVMTPHLD